MVTTVLFDLDGTLLPMEQEPFLKAYFGGLSQWAAPYGYDSKALIDNLWRGTAAMVKNDGSRSNQQVFWDSWAASFGEESRAHEAVFEGFYRGPFEEISKVCGFTPSARAIIDFLKARSIRLILATNPIFPAVATHARTRWTGLQPEEFAYITTYENSRHSKPNPDYYRDILAAIGAKPEECLMVGNDATEDLAAAKLGIPVFLVTDHLINSKEIDLSEIPHGDFADLQAWMERMLTTTPES